MLDLLKKMKRGLSSAKGPKKEYRTGVKLMGSNLKRGITQLKSRKGNI